MLAEPSLLFVKWRLIYLMLVVTLYSLEVISIFVKRGYIFSHLLLSPDAVLLHEFLELPKMDPDQRCNLLLAFYKFLQLLFFIRHQTGIVHVERTINITCQLSKPKDSSKMGSQAYLFKDLSFSTVLQTLRWIGSTSRNSKLSFKCTLNIFILTLFSSTSKILSSLMITPPQLMT